MRGLLWIVGPVILLGASCASAGAVPAPASAAPAAASTDAQFFGELGYKDVASAADAARAVAILASEGAQNSPDFEANKAYLMQRGILPDGWLNKAAADASIDKGHLASLICRALGIKGGLWMRLFGPQPRLALRECAYLGLMMTGCDYRHVSGGELVGVIDRADRLRAAQAGKPAPKLEGEPSGAAEVKR
jgi:hypothetical protein